MIRNAKYLLSAALVFSSAAFVCAAPGASSAAASGSLAERTALYAESGNPHVAIESTTQLDHAVKYTFRYLGAHDAPVEAYAYVPIAATAAAPAPCLILIHGLGGSKESMEPLALITASMGYASIMIDQAGQGARATVKGLPTFASEADLATALRSNTLTTVVDLRRAIDSARYLPGVDPKRIGVVGYSLGALVGAVLSGVDKRVDVTVLMAVGGNLGKILNVEAATHMPLGGYYAALITSIPQQTLEDQLADVDPINFVASIAPRPLLMLNGRKDTVIPPDCAQALFDAAGVGKQITWFDDSGHILPWIPVYADMAAFIYQHMPVARQ